MCKWSNKEWIYNKESTLATHKTFILAPSPTIVKARASHHPCAPKQSLELAGVYLVCSPNAERLITNKSLHTPLMCVWQHQSRHTNESSGGGLPCL